MKTRLVIADDHPMVILGVMAALADDPNIEVCGTATSSTDLVVLLQQQKPDVLICDFQMPDGKYGDGMNLISHLKRHFPELRIIILTMMTNPPILNEILKAGVEGLLLKGCSADEMRAAVRSACGGHYYLSKTTLAQLNMRPGAEPNTTAHVSVKELEVLRLYVNGLSVSEIARKLCRSIKTISSQKQSAQRKLGINNEKELYEYAQSQGLTGSH